MPHTRQPPKVQTGRAAPNSVFICLGFSLALCLLLSLLSMPSGFNSVNEFQILSITSVFMQVEKSKGLKVFRHNVQRDRLGCLERGSVGLKDWSLPSWTAGLAMLVPL